MATAPSDKTQIMQILWQQLSKDRFTAIYLAGLFLLAAGLPLSKTAMSMALLLLAIHWLISKSYRNLPSLRSSSGLALVFFLLIFAIHIFGLIYTTDFRYAFKDLRIKAPLLILPLFLASGPVPGKQTMRNVLHLFVLAVFAGSLIALYQQLVFQPVDPRDLTPFISHIRFSMMVCLAAVISFKTLISSSSARYEKITMLLPALWLPVALLMLQSLTGLVAAFLIMVAILFMGMSQKNRLWIRLSCAGVLLAGVIGTLAFALNLRNEFHPAAPHELSSLDSLTARGNAYVHHLASPLNENGHLIMIYLAVDEMKEAWNLRSTVAFDTPQPRGGTTGDVLIRYLSSKGLRKDADGVNALTDHDIAAIEKGSTNYLYDHWSGLRRKIDQLKWEYWNYLGGGDAMGHSLMQRIELWSAGVMLARENILIGVGTGDLKQSFKVMLEKRQSSLANTPLRAHNQYLTILITFGLLGALLFLAALIIPLIIQRHRIGVLETSFLVIVFFSMLVEDTLETQVGVSFFTFFFVLFFLMKSPLDPERPTDTPRDDAGAL